MFKWAIFLVSASLETSYLSTFEGEKLLRVICAKPMTELNEITHHMLSCIDASLQKPQEIAQRRVPSVLLSALETLVNKTRYL